MSLSVADLRRIADDAVRATSPALEVGGVSLTGGSDYSEVLITIRGCRTHPCQLTVGLFRDVSETTFRNQMVAELRRHMGEHLPPD